MVGIAQLVERGLVVADVAGSSPVTHPKYFFEKTGHQVSESRFAPAPGNLGERSHD